MGMLGCAGYTLIYKYAKRDAKAVSEMIVKIDAVHNQ